MKKLIVILLSAIACVILGLLLAPLFINLNAYKNQLSETIKTVTGVAPTMNGDIHIRFFPSPAIKVSDVLIPNQIPNTASANIVSIKTIEVESSYAAFLQGKVDIQHIKFINPVLELERLKDGTKNWNIFFSKKVKEDPQNANPVPAILPEQIIVENGSIVYYSESVRTTLDYIQGTLNIKSADGPFMLEGRGETKENIISFSGETGKLSENGIAKLHIFSDAFDVNFSGNYAKENENTVIKGQMVADVPKLNSFTKAFFTEGSLFSAINAPQALKITSDFLVNAQTVSLYGLTINSDSIKGTGAVDVLFRGAGEGGVNWDIRVGFSSIDFDTLIVQDAPKSAVDNEIDYYASSLKHQGLTNYNLDIPKELSLLIDISAEKVKYHEEHLENIRIDMDVFDGKALIHKLVADLPGNSTIEFTGSVTHNGVRPLLKGNLKSSGEKFRKIVNWLYPESVFLPEEQLNDFLLSCNINMTPQKINLTDIYGSVDKLLVTGSLNMLPRAKIPLIEVELKLDRMNLDQYLLTERIDQWFKKFLAQVKDENLANSWLKTLNTNASIIINASDLIYNTHEIKNLNLVLGLSPGIFNIQRLVFNGESAAFTSQLKINLLPDHPVITLDTLATGIDTSAFILPLTTSSSSAATDSYWSKEPFNFWGLERFDGSLNLNIGIFKHGDLLLKNLKIVGDLSKRLVTIKDFSASFGNGTFHAEGGIGISAMPSVAASFKFSNVNLYELLHVLRTPTPLYGLISIVGTFRTNGETPYHWISNLKGKVEFSAHDVTLPSFDLHSIIKGAAELYSVIDMQHVVQAAFGGEGTTILRTIGGQIQLEKNIVKAESIGFSTDYSRGVLAGNFDLHSFLTNLGVRFVFAPVPKSRVNLLVTLKGALDRLERTLDTKDLDNYITSKGSISGTNNTGAK